MDKIVKGRVERRIGVRRLGAAFVLDGLPSRRCFDFLYFNYLYQATLDSLSDSDLEKSESSAYASLSHSEKCHNIIPGLR